MGNLRRVIRSTVGLLLLSTSLVLPAAEATDDASDEARRIPSTSPAGLRETTPRKAPVGAITFDEVPYGTSVTDEYRSYGVIFTSAAFTTDDNASSSNPVLSGSPLFAGPITGYFTKPGTSTRTTVSGFSLDLGYINNRDSVEVSFFDPQGAWLGATRAQSLAFNHIDVRLRGIASFAIKVVDDEPAGYAIDNLLIVREALGAKPTSMAAFGDSYSSGEGLVPERGLSYDCGTDLLDGYYYQDSDVRAGAIFYPSNCDTRTLSHTRPADFHQRPSTHYRNKCHRNSRAYPGQIRKGLGISNGHYIFVACSGAVTEDIRYNGQYSDPGSPVNVHGGDPQLATVERWRGSGSDPELITVGIGGNDAGFAEIIEYCMLHSCSDDEEWKAGWVTKIQGEVHEQVEATFAGLRINFPGSTIAAFGYPSVIGDPEDDCGGFKALWMKVETPERAWLKHTIFRRLNEAIREAAADAGVTFVDITTATSGHEICTEDPWVNGLRLGREDTWTVVASESFHPNQKGHDAVAALFLKRYTANGRLIFSNPSPASTIRPEPGAPIYLGQVDAGATVSCGEGCEQPAPCIQACSLVLQGSGFAPDTPLQMALVRPATGGKRPVAGYRHVLGTVLTDASGQVAQRVSLPRGVPAGVLSLRLTGDASGVPQIGTQVVQVFSRRPPSRQRLYADVQAATKQRLKRRAVVVRCASSAPSRCAVDATVRIGGTVIKARKVRVLKKPDRRYVVRVVFTRAEARQISQALKHRRSVKVRLNGTATRAGQRVSERLTVYLR